MQLKKNSKNEYVTFSELPFADLDENEERIPRDEATPFMDFFAEYVQSFDGKFQSRKRCKKSDEIAPKVISLSTEKNGKTLIHFSSEKNLI
jgi:hypothetical protein